MAFRSSFRSAAAVVSGYGLFAGSGALLVLGLGVDPHGPTDLGFKLVATAYGGAFALLSGLLTRRVAGDGPSTPSIVVAGLAAAGATASLIATLGEGAIWSQLETIFIFAPLIAGAGGVRPGRPRKRDVPRA